MWIEGRSRLLRMSTCVQVCCPLWIVQATPAMGKFTASQTISPWLWTFYFLFPSGVLFYPMTEVRWFFSVEAVLLKERR